MKELKKLKFEELTTRQKLGMTFTAHIFDYGLHTPEEIEDNLEFALELIRNHSLGAIWVDSVHPRFYEVMQKVKEAADYPILIMRDAECGIDKTNMTGPNAGRYIGAHNAIGATGDPEIAYAFGKVTGVLAREMGFNVVCNPVLDMIDCRGVCGHNMRSMGGDKYKVAELAMAEAQGLKDAGVLTVAKHYPGANGDHTMDSHMAEVLSMETEEKLLDYNLYPYIQLNNKGLLDGIMTQHSFLPNIDPKFPSSLSKKIIGLYRDQGFNGFAITDAIVMRGIAAKFGERNARGLAIANGNDLALTWELNRECFESIVECYDKGLITDERLDEAVCRVLAAQEKTLAEPKVKELTEEDFNKCEGANRDVIYARTDEGLETALDKDGKYFFVVLSESEMEINDNGKVNVDTMGHSWHDVPAIVEKLEKTFKNSQVYAINQFPTPLQTENVLRKSVPYDEVVFVTFIEAAAYIGRECLTSRVISMIQALQVTNRVSTVVHFGNPFVLEDLVHIPRIIIGCASKYSVDYTLDVLAGDLPAKGVLTYDVNFK